MRKCNKFLRYRYNFVTSIFVRSINVIFAIRYNYEQHLLQSFGRMGPFFIGRIISFTSASSSILNQTSYVIYVVLKKARRIFDESSKDDEDRISDEPRSLTRKPRCIHRRFIRPFFSPSFSSHANVLALKTSLAENRRITTFFISTIKIFSIADDKRFSEEMYFGREE